MYSKVVLVLAMMAGPATAFVPRGATRSFALRKGSSLASTDTPVDDISAAKAALESLVADEPAEEAATPASAPSPTSAPAATAVSPAEPEPEVSAFDAEAKIRAEVQGVGRFAGTQNAQFLARFTALPRAPHLDGSHAGDRGFDPLNYGADEAKLFGMMESEVRHGRLAMLCVLGWPMAELHPWLKPSFYADGGRAPSLSNGHLFDAPNAATVTALFMLWGAIESIQEKRAADGSRDSALYGRTHAQDMAGVWQSGKNYGVAGDWGFDPLGLYGAFGRDAAGRKVMRELEIDHGRWAMGGVLGYVLFEVRRRETGVENSRVRQVGHNDIVPKT